MGSRNKRNSFFGFPALTVAALSVGGWVLNVAKDKSQITSSEVRVIARENFPQRSLASAVSQSVPQQSKSTSNLEELRKRILQVQERKVHDLTGQLDATSRDYRFARGMIHTFATEPVQITADFMKSGEATTSEPLGVESGATLIPQGTKLAAFFVRSCLKQSPLGLEGLLRQGIDRESVETLPVSVIAIDVRVPAGVSLQELRDMVLRDPCAAGVAENPDYKV